MNRLVNTLLMVLFSLWLAGQCLFVVREYDKVVLLQFGKIVQSDIAPGVHL
jgi:regulator of protease activity HflC (stomatin/prohibitin superfamily)